MKYEFAQNNLKAPQRYSYTRFGGVDFLDCFLQNRQSAKDLIKAKLSEIKSIESERAAERERERERTSAAA